MRRSAVALLLAGGLLQAVHAAEEIGWYTAPAEAQSARSYWIAGPQGVIVLGTQLVSAETEAMLYEAQSRTGRKVLMALVLAPTPAQFNGTALLQKRGITVYTSQQVAGAIPAVHAEARDRLRRELRSGYPAAAPRPVGYGDTTRQMLIGGVQFQLHPLGPGTARAHLVVEYDHQLFAGDLLAGPVHPVLQGGSLIDWFKRLQELRKLKPRRIYPAHGEPGGMGLIWNQMIYIKQLMDFIAAENPQMPVVPDAGRA